MLRDCCVLCDVEIYIYIYLHYKFSQIDLAMIVQGFIVSA
jgi:hypothetical protein